MDDGDYYGGVSDVATDNGTGKLGLSFLALGILGLMTYYVVTRSNKK